VSSTRERILDAARRLAEKAPGAAPSMSEVARATGISRQALYGYFPDRAALLLAVVEHVDQVENLAAGIAAFEAAPSGPAQVRTWVGMQARRNPRIAAFARALDQSRHGDDSATAAWRDRTANRMRGATAVALRLRSEGLLHRSWTTPEAATLVWELVSFRVWDDLVNEAGLTPERYTDIVTTAVLATLAAPVRRERSSSRERIRSSR
jgi:AcrR family transcriptional regulator